MRFPGKRRLRALGSDVIPEVAEIYDLLVGDLRGLIVDYGGVLTTSLTGTISAWTRTDGIDPARFDALIRRWSQPGAPGSPVHDLETGRLPLEDFERLLAAELTGPAGTRPPAPGMVQRMLAGFELDPDMVAAVATARASGIRTALLSNSWGLDYPRARWGELFDAVVISGEVGMRKPEAEIYRHTAGLLGLDAAQCVFVDDLAVNVRGAVAAGMVGVCHAEADRTLEELESLFSQSFR